MKDVRILDDMFIAAGTPLHYAVQRFLFKTAAGLEVDRSHIRKAEHEARLARGALLEELDERIGRDVKVWFELMPPDDLMAYRLSMFVSDGLLQYAVFGEPAVFRRLVNKMVEDVCKMVRHVTEMREKGTPCYCVGCKGRWGRVKGGDVET